MNVAETPRLTLRRLTLDDAPFYLQLLNEPSWLAHIGDRGVRTPEEAQAHIAAHILAPYARHGFGMYLVQRRGDGTALGLCGLVQREALPAPDIGFALLQQHEGLGYAREAAQAVLWHAFRELQLPRLLAITAPTNLRSTKLLGALGFHFQGMVPVGDRSLRLYALARS
ncbi:N-acetyltransferase [Pseudorhodoferax aquiterrae]|uniref:N-acetyltransferase n=1 Tax=Pseudorhodoferax aquiterrae TaxID=747304 RepID=A0ABQ3GCM5_9BURK|nr:GNAT family N-acetyltransferase [Pseudorhodoferax aquiterrae]GHD00475.1 N-acetyltransferase [Pseudorhodoferax aquiterrae]